MKKMNLKFLKTGMTLLLAVTAWVAQAQDKFFTRTGKAYFTCGTDLETIEANNNGANCVLVPSTGQIQAAVLMKAFEFEKDLMEQHFNENYVESDKFPKSTFAGHVTDIGGVDFRTNGGYPVKVKGQITVHGVTRDLGADAVIEVRGENLHVTLEFTLVLADFDIGIPGVVRDKIAKEAQVKLDFELQPLAGKP